MVYWSFKNYVSVPINYSSRSHFFHLVPLLQYSRENSSIKWLFQLLWDEKKCLFWRFVHFKTKYWKQPCCIGTNFIFPNFDLENKPIFLLKVWKLFFLFWVLLYNDKSFRVSVANILLAPGYGHIRWRVASFLSLKVYFSNFDLKNEPIFLLKVWKLFPIFLVLWTITNPLAL